MPGTTDLVKFSAASVLSVAVLRYLWKKFLVGNSRQIEKPSESPSKAKEASSGQQPEDGLWIYFGSQSGTAEGFAKELEQEAGGFDIQATAVDMENFDPDEFARHKCVVLVMATYGEGDPTDNAIDFYKWLQDESLESDTMEKCKFTVMGLGNRQYVNFNSCGKEVDKHMARNGGQRIYHLGLGDDDQNIEEDWEQWKKGGLWSAIREVLGMGAERKDSQDPGGLDSAETVVSRLPLRAEVSADGGAPTTDPLVEVGGADVLGKWYFNAFPVPVTTCYELRQKPVPDAGRTTKHIEWDVNSFPGIEWRTADNCEVLPGNPKEVVDWFAGRLGVEDQQESKLSFVRAPGIDKAVKKPFPACSVGSALQLFCDLAAAPPTAAAKRIGALALDEEDREALHKLLEDRDTYQWLIGDGVRLTMREFFEFYLHSAEVEVGTFVQLCPRQKSRPYTISSSSKENKDHLGICVSMVKEELCTMEALVAGLVERGHELPKAACALERLKKGHPNPRRFHGLCSTMLTHETTVGEKLWITVRASTFRLPRTTTTPIIMICAGTGVAPMRAFVREFMAEKGTRQRTMLFFGCQNSDDDYLYKDEFEAALRMEPPALSELILAFSRQQAHKVYVQHRVRERASDVASWIKDGGYIFVCGGNSMGRSIREEVAAALGDTDHVSRLQTEGRYIEELW